MLWKYCTVGLPLRNILEGNRGYSQVTLLLAGLASTSFQLFIQYMSTLQVHRSTGLSTKSFFLECVFSSEIQ